MNISGNILDFQFASWRDTVINIIIAFALGFVIAWVYRRTHRGFSYSVSFVHTLLLLSMITALVMMVIGNNIARAFSLVGALSIIRFRTPVKDTRDTAFVFFSLAIGMATGTGSHSLAILGTTTISLLALAMHRIRLGEPRGGSFLLKFRLRTSPDSENVYQDVFSKHLKQSTLVNMATVQQGPDMELSFSITLRDAHRQQQLLHDLNALSEVGQVMLMAVDEGGEY